MYCNWNLRAFPQNTKNGYNLSSVFPFNQYNCNNNNLTSHFQYGQLFTDGNQIVQLVQPNSCSLCLAKNLQDASNFSIQVPMQVEVPTAVWDLDPSHGCTSFGSALDSSNLRMNGEIPPPFAQPYVYLPKTASSSSNRKESELKPYKRKVGIDLWYMKRCRERHQAAWISRNKLQRTQKVIKRLQNHQLVKQWKIEQVKTFEEKESIRQSKLEILRRKGIKSIEKDECPLWNCPKKMFQRKSSFMSRNFENRRRSASRLSNLSKKSRSPIVFQRTP